MFDFSKYGTKILVRIPFLYTSLTNAVPVKKIVHAPNPCWSGNSDNGDAIINGTFYWMGHLESNILTPWATDSAPYSWVEYAHSFNWMYDTRLSSIPNNRQIIRDWVTEWLNQYDTISQPIWRSDIVAQRLTNWLVHFDHYFTNADKALKDKILASITQHYKHLEITEGNECDNARKITSLRGLIIGAISLDQQLNIKKYVLDMAQILEDNLSRDGLNKSGHLPTQVSFLKDCILVRSALHNAQMDVPTILNNLVEKMVPAVKFFLQPDGDLAHMAGWTCEHTPIQQILNRSGSKDKVPTVLEDSGFYHIGADKTSILFDAHDRRNIALDNAGVLSFEMSYKKQRIFVNCGYPMGSDNALFSYARGTPAHSTFSIQDYNAISLGKKTRMSRTKSSLTMAEGWQLLQGQHSGYLDVCGCPIKRAISINQNGTEIRGQDKLEQISGVHNFENRFHLHPKIDAMILSNNKEVILRHGKIGWRFRASGGEINLEESFYIEKDGTRRKTQQIVIRTKSIAQNVTIKWVVTIL